MNHRSTPDPLPVNTPQRRPSGSPGPSDSSDSGSDLIGPGLIDEDQLGLDRGTNEDSEGGHLDAVDGASIGEPDASDDSDRDGTGERIAAGKEPSVVIGADIAPDRIVGPEEAGLGGGLDQAEEAILGITDEEIREKTGRDEEDWEP
jgi:hypothetical protein